MTNKENLFRKFSECVDNCSYTSNFADENTNICIDIADRYVIDFMFWTKRFLEKNIEGKITIEELIEIYKKQNYDN